MKARIVNRMVGVFLIGAMSLVGTSRLANAQPARQDQTKAPHDQGDAKKAKKQQKPPQDQSGTNKQKKQPKQPVVETPQHQPVVDQKPQHQPPVVQTPQHQPVVVETPQHKPPVVEKPKQQSHVTVKPQRLPPERQQQLIVQQRERTTQYHRHLQDQERLAQQRAEALRQQKRLAQYRFQQRYYERLRQQRSYLDRYEQSYAYNRDPYFYTAPSYRYARGGSYYEINRYGADLLRQAVNYGYEEGFEAGRADREDRWGNGYEDSFAFQDANYGYRGYYVDQDTYNYYFREGFRRGYEDGYNSRYQYGRRSNGALIVLASVLAGIVVFEALDH